MRLSKNINFSAIIEWLGFVERSKPLITFLILPFVFLTGYDPGYESTYTKHNC